MFVSFAGFFRFNELCNIAPNHIKFHSQYIKIFVPRSKTDVYREGNYVYISASESQYCPVSVLSLPSFLCQLITYRKVNK